jgi:hypothetical protein
MSLVKIQIVLCSLIELVAQVQQIVNGDMNGKSTLTVSSMTRSVSSISRLHGPQSVVSST